MDDEIDAGGKRSRESGRIVGQEVQSAPSATNPRAQREVQAKVGIGDKQDSDGLQHLYMV